MKKTKSKKVKKVAPEVVAPSPKKSKVHNFKDGDIITDTHLKECFTYKENSHGVMAVERAEDLREATDDEKTLLIMSHEDAVKIN